MMPWSHIAIGYLTYTAVTRLGYRRSPDGGPTVVLAFATLVPDLVDKPLNWWFGIYDGRAIGHSLLAAGVLCTLLSAGAVRYDRSELGAAFSVGYLTHLFADSWTPVSTGAFDEVSYLFWPVVSPPVYGADRPIHHFERVIDGVRLLSASPVTFLERLPPAPLTAATVLFVVWALDGFPGVRLVKR